MFTLWQGLQQPGISLVKKILELKFLPFVPSSLIFSGVCATVLTGAPGTLSVKIYNHPLQVVFIDGQRFNVSYLFCFQLL